MEFGQFASVPFFAVHLICMNIASAGPLVCIWLERRAIRKSDKHASILGKRLAWHSMGLFLIGIVLGLGIALVFWTQDSEAFTARWMPYRNKIWWGVWELLTYVVAMAIYLAMWPKILDRGSQPGMVRICVHRFLAVFAATNLLYHFPPLFSAIALHDGAAQTSEIISAADFRTIVYTPQIMSQTVHFWFASFAVVGAWLMFQGRTVSEASNQVFDGQTEKEKGKEMSKPGTPTRESTAGVENIPASTTFESSTSESSTSESTLDGTWPLRAGARLALAFTAVQILVGVWVTLSLPQSSLVLGGDWLATSALGLSVVLTFVLLNQLATISFGVPDWPTARRANVVLLLIILLMSTTLRSIR